MSGLVSISGLISGIRTDEVIQKILEVERRTVERYQGRQETLRARQKAFGEANTRLLALKEALGQLSSASFYASRSATSGRPEAVAATAAVGATPGEYVITVEALARAHQLLSQSFTDVDATRLGSGTLTFVAGGVMTTIQVDESNNTLAGLRTAINAANSNVRAAIVQDADSSYRLMLTSAETGAANAITITSTLAGGTAPTFTDLQSAQDARLTLGEGAGAITVTRSSNTVADMLPGVTLTLLEASADRPITVTVARDDGRITEALQKLVDQYNHAVDFFNQQFKYDPDTGSGGLLNGDLALRQIQSDLYQAITGRVTGVDRGSLSDIGVTMNGDGKLSLNLAAFEERLKQDPVGVMRTLALSSESTHTGIELLSTGAKTRIDGTAFEVEITQAARPARVTAGNAQTGALAADETLILNGVEIALTAGMTQAQVIQAINARARETGVRASGTAADGTGTGNHLTLRSIAYGSGAAVSVVSDRSSGAGDSTGIGNVTATAADPRGEGGSGTGEAGLDIAGTINGESATGSGQVLTGAEENPTTAGLRLRITAATAGSLGSIRLFSGIAHAAERVVSELTHAADGRIKSENDSLQARIDDLQEIINRREEAIQRRAEQIRRQFSAMEEAMSRFQNQAQFLAGQLRQS